MRLSIPRLAIYTLKATSISVTTTVAVAFSIDYSGVADCSGLSHPRSWLHVILSGMILSPLLESALLTSAIRWIRAISNGSRLACIMIPALLASSVHGAFCVWWGFAVMPAFVVYAKAVIDHCDESWTKACFVTFGIHALHNAAVIVVGRALE